MKPNKRYFYLTLLVFGLFATLFWCELLVHFPGNSFLGTAKAKRLVFLFALFSSCLCLIENIRIVSSENEQHWIFYYICIILSGSTVLLQFVVSTLFDFLYW